MNGENDRAIVRLGQSDQALNHVKGVVSILEELISYEILVAKTCLTHQSTGGLIQK